jgi:branched-chain amino acid aminotransferase
MAVPYPQMFYRDRLVPAEQATLGVATSAVLYGLSVYTVLPVRVADGRRTAFRLREHYRRLVESCSIIGIDRFTPQWTFERFVAAVEQVVATNAPARAQCANWVDRSGPRRRGSRSAAGSAPIRRGGRELHRI